MPDAPKLVKFVVHRLELVFDPLKSPGKLPCSTHDDCTHRDYGGQPYYMVLDKLPAGRNPHNEGGEADDAERMRKMKGTDHKRTNRRFNAHRQAWT